MFRYTNASIYHRSKAGLTLSAGILFPDSKRNESSDISLEGWSYRVLSRGWSKLAPVTLVALLQRDTQWGRAGGGAGEVKWRSDVGNGKRGGGKKEAARERQEKEE